MVKMMGVEQVLSYGGVNTGLRRLTLSRRVKRCSCKLPGLLLPGAPLSFCATIPANFPNSSNPSHSFIIGIIERVMLTSLLNSGYTQIHGGFSTQL